MSRALHFPGVPTHLTTKQVAERLGITSNRVLALIRAGRLPAERIGVQYLIKPESLRLVRVRKPGRPPKTTSGRAKK